MEKGQIEPGILSGLRVRRQAASLDPVAKMQGFPDRVPVEKAADTAYRKPDRRPRLSIPSSLK
jgi:hypothetical protein